MKAKAISFFGGVLEREEFNSEDDLAQGVVFFSIAFDNGQVRGGCVRVKQTVGAQAGLGAPLEVEPPVGYSGPPVDQNLLGDIVRWYWSRTVAKQRESLIGGSAKIPGSILRLKSSINLAEQASLLFDREALGKIIDGETRRP